VFLGGKKVAGALCKAETVGDRCHLHMGIGINLNTVADPDTQSCVRTERFKLNPEEVQQ